MCNLFCSFMFVFYWNYSHFLFLNLLFSKEGKEKTPIITNRHLFLSAPASVSEVTVSNRGRSDALQVSWRPAVGVVDSYLVRLQDGSGTVHTLAVSRSSLPECSFSSLVAGRLYSVVIVTRSGSLENATTVQERTRKEELHLLVRYIYVNMYFPWFVFTVMFVLVCICTVTCIGVFDTVTFPILQVTAKQNKNVHIL